MIVFSIDKIGGALLFLGNEPTAYIDSLVYLTSSTADLTLSGSGQFSSSVVGSCFRTKCLAACAHDGEMLESVFPSIYSCQVPASLS